MFFQRESESLASSFRGGKVLQAPKEEFPAQFA